MAFDLEKRKIYSSESRPSTSGDACIQLSIYRPKPAVKLCNRWTTPLSRIPSRIHLFSGKIISFAALKKTGINVEVTQHDKKIFVRLSGQLEMVNWKAYRKDRNLLQNNPNSHGYLGKKIPMFRNALLIIYFSPHFRFGHQIFAFWEPYGWTSRAFWRSNITCNEKYCFQQEPLDCLRLMLLSGNWFSICLCNSEEIYWWELLN